MRDLEEIEISEAQERALVRDTSDGSLASPRNSMQKFYFDKTDVVRSVSALLKHLQRGSQSIITIERDLSGDYCVNTVTTVSSADTGKTASPSSKD
jgi:hypothetical protein